MMTTIGWFVAMLVGAGLIVWGAELFAENLVAASSRLGVSTFALALLLAGAEPEELATVVTASSRGVDGVAFGDVIGANVAALSLALGLGAIITTVPFDTRARRYGGAGMVAVLVAGLFVWDGHVGRPEGAILTIGYVAFVAWIWAVERQPPAFGEIGELTKPQDSSGRLGPELTLVLFGLAALTGGSILLVEGVRQLSGIESTQTRLGLTVVGLATAFELVVLAWSAGRRGLTETIVAAVLGSFVYNLTMSLGAGAVIAPITISEPIHLRAPYVVMGALLLAVLMMTRRGEQVTRSRGLALVTAYALFLAVALTT